VTYHQSINVGSHPVSKAESIDLNIEAGNLNVQCGKLNDEYAKLMINSTY